MGVQQRRQRQKEDLAKALERAKEVGEQVSRKRGILEGLKNNPEDPSNSAMIERESKLCKQG